MNRKLIFWILLFGLIGIIGLVFFMSNFQIFDEPIETSIKSECDFEGIRKITLSEIKGNAVSNNTFNINVSNCDENNSKSKLVFTANSSSLTVDDIRFYWQSFDTLIIEYNRDFEIFKQLKVADNVKPKVLIEYIIKQQKINNNENPKKDELINKSNGKNEDKGYKEYMFDKLKPIRENKKRIDAITEWTKTDKRKLGKSNEIGKGYATYFYIKDTLIKIEAVYIDNNEKKTSFYYTSNGNLSYVNEKIPDKEGIVEVESFFNNVELIRQINNRDCGSPFAKDYLLEEQNRLINEFNSLNNRLKN